MEFSPSLSWHPRAKFWYTPLELVPNWRPIAMAASYPPLWWTQVLNKTRKRPNSWWQKWWRVRRMFFFRKVYLINDTKWSWYHFRFCSWILRNICFHWPWGRSIPSFLRSSLSCSGYPFLSFFLGESALSDSPSGPSWNKNQASPNLTSPLIVLTSYPLPSFLKENLYLPHSLPHSELTS